MAFFQDSWCGACVRACVGGLVGVRVCVGVHARVHVSGHALMPAWVCMVCSMRHLGLKCPGRN